MSQSSKGPSLGGFVLPSVVVLSLVVLTLAAVWYRQITVQSYLAERVLEQKALLLECRSLLPYLKRRLEDLSRKEIVLEQSDFLVVRDGSAVRWRIDRSAWIDNRVKFAFSPVRGGGPDRIVLTVRHAVD